MQKIKFTDKAREIAIRRQKRKREHECLRNRKRAALQKFYQIRNQKTPVHSVGAQRAVIDLPENFDLHTNYETVVRTMNEFRDEIEKPPQKLSALSLNFNSIAKIGISSALVLAADIDVWRIKHGKLRSHHDQWQPQIRTLLNEMGLFELLQMPRLDADAKAAKSETSFVKFLSAQKADGKKARELRERIETAMSKKLDLEYRQKLYTSLSEALANAKQHAYHNADNLRTHEKWWITAAYDGKEKRLTVAMYDRGQTIPVTMEKSERWEEFFVNFPLLVNNHAELIKIAMQESVDAEMDRSTATKTRTSTHQLNRGKGLRQLLDLLFLPALEKTGKVHIISGKGYCCFTVKSGELAVETAKNVWNPMRGTLVEWQIDV